MQSHALITEPVRTSERSQIVDVTDAVRRIVRKLGPNATVDGAEYPHQVAAVSGEL